MLDADLEFDGQASISGPLADVLKSKQMVKLLLQQLKKASSQNSRNILACRNWLSWQKLKLVWQVRPQKQADFIY